MPANFSSYNFSEMSNFAVCIDLVPSV